MSTNGLYGNSGNGAVVAVAGAQTGGLYGDSPTGAVVAGPDGESAGLYGQAVVYGGTYFEWSIFYISPTQPATPTNGSWNFETNVGTLPSGWLMSPPSNPTSTVWVSISIVNSRNENTLTWSTPGLYFMSGYSGISGYSGFSGISGYSGFSGISGYSGFSGISGYSGISGFSGFSGISGYSGSGVSGYSGYSGFSGISGYSGSGVSGWSGYSGISGFSGYSGISGFSGSGVSGWSGISGYSGFSGISGYSGSGVSGYSGFSGYSGQQGTSINVKGSVANPTLLPLVGNNLNDAYIVDSNGDLYIWTGTTWNNVGEIVGPTGQSGISGFSGYSGISGFSGFSGISGFSGFSGFSGISGFSGSGISGFSGYSGFSGISGYSGSGVSGWSGYSGISGFSGSGVSGYSGYSGLGYYGLTATGSNSLSLGSKSFTTNLDASTTAFTVGQYIRVFATSVPSQYMEGLITAFTGTSLTVNMTYVNGGASFTNWTITASGAVGTSGYSGYSGYSGATGATGTSGFSGYSGATGATGASGYSGYSGSGVSGYSGYSGSGLSGYSGYSGYSGSATTRTVTDFTPTSGQTTFTVNYTVGYLDVYRNGAKLAAADITATNGTSFTIAACTTTDVVQSVSFFGVSLGGSGYSGYSGYSGSGISGYSGYSGYSGATGTSGFSGYSGYSGATGTSGYSGYSGATGYYSFKNRIINGAMMIDQRNAGASVTVTTSGQFAVDRFQSAATAGSKFSMQQNAGSVTPPAGFANYLGATSLSSYSVGSTDVFGLRQIVEGFNAADLAWGTANAQPITISFWVRSSLTGTFGLGLGNSGFSRAYAATYTINSANTWEYKTVTIAGDTTGTWLTTNGAGIQLTFGLGYGSSYSGTAGVWNAGSYFMPTGATSVVGTNGATFYITGVQLEKGSTATSFDYRPYGTELALCQRYYQQVADTYGKGVGGVAGATNGLPISYAFPVQMRTTPTLTISANGAANTMWVMATAGTISATPASTWWDQYSFVGIQANSPFTTGAGYFCGFKANAEL